MADLTDTGTVSTAYDDLGITPVINACGIYTDLGGSCMSESVWHAAGEANGNWASMPELLDRSGELIAELLTVEAARVVPGASAGLALAVAACITGHDGRPMEQLPDTRGLCAGVLMQRGHRYKYTRCALMSGAHLVEVGDPGVSEDAFAVALRNEIACVLHPAHLDDAPGTIPLERVTRLAREARVPVVVDAAYMSYPTDLIAEYGQKGADLTCFSAKYFWGPNAGGFIYGHRDLIDVVAELDFTGFESGEHRIFGRAFKMDRATVIATTLALREWLTIDHDARWAAYQRRADAIVAALRPRIPRGLTTGCFTLDERLIQEPVNSVLLRCEDGGVPGAARVAAVLADGSPSIHAAVVGDTIAFCLETVAEEEDQLLVGEIPEALDLRS